MYCALYLRHLLTPAGSNHPGGTQCVAVAKTYDELRNWYVSHIVQEYKEEGPDPYSGRNKVYTKYFAKDGPLEWYHLSDSMQLDDDHSATGFIQIETYEELAERITIETEQKINVIRMAAQEALDMYRTDIEPKMISYDPTNNKPTLQ